MIAAIFLQGGFELRREQFELLSQGFTMFRETNDSLFENSLDGNLRGSDGPGFIGNVVFAGPVAFLWELHGQLVEQRSCPIGVVVMGIDLPFVGWKLCQDLVDLKVVGGILNSNFINLGVLGRFL